MIISDISRRMTIIEGHSLAVAQEFAGVVRTIMQSSPELYIAVTAVLADTSAKLLKDVDQDKLSYYASKVEEFIKENEKGGVWND